MKQIFYKFQPSSSIEPKKLKNVIETIEDDIEACRIENNVTEGKSYNYVYIIAEAYY